MKVYFCVCFVAFKCYVQHYLHIYFYDENHKLAHRALHFRFDKDN